MKDATCPDGHRFESLVKMDQTETPCREEGCSKMAVIDEIAQLTHFDKLGTHANYSSLRLHFNFTD